MVVWGYSIEEIVMSKLVEMVFEDGSKHLVDTETGEVKYDIFPVKWESNPVYVKGIDEVDCKAPEELRQRSEAMGYKTVSDGLQDIMEDAELSHLEARVLIWLGGRVVGQNLSMVTVNDICSSLKIDKTQVSRVLSGLEDKKYITLEHRNTFGVGSRVLEVHPGYFWRGNYAIRDKYRVRWYKKYAPSREEVLYSCPLVQESVK